MKYRFIEQYKNSYPIKRMCALLNIKRSSNYAWKKRRPSQRELINQILLNHIRRIHKLYRKVYGSPRIHAALKNEGHACNRKTVARIMRENGIKGQRKAKKVMTTNSKHAYPVAKNLLNRDFQAEKPNQKWVADITYIPTNEGWLIPGECPGFVFTENCGLEHVQPNRCKIGGKSTSNGFVSKNARKRFSPSF